MHQGRDRGGQTGKHKTSPACSFRLALCPEDAVCIATHTPMHTYARPLSVRAAQYTRVLSPGAADHTHLHHVQP